MKRMLLFAVASCCITAVPAQDSKKITAYAITGVYKGSSNWTEVRLVDISTGTELQSIYNSSQTVEALNARSGRPITKKESAAAQESKSERVIEVMHKDADGKVTKVDRRVIIVNEPIQYDKPFATNSAALAFDRKHDRLYYTPMGINELRYIDLKSGNIYYFQDESFGPLKNRHDVPKHITRMVIASDGNGYALTNDAKHLIQFTTGKKPKITDLGSLTDDPSNGVFSVHNRDCYGGDMIADVDKNLYLITASRNVFKISLETRVATFMGTIRGLPKGFTTNGAAVEEGSKVIVTSSVLTQGYYRFDLNTMQAEKISGETSVYNASDLANGNLAFDKKKKNRKEKEITRNPGKPETTDVVQTDQQDQTKPQPGVASENLKNSITIFPNPVTNGLVKLSFNDQPQGRYTIQFMDVAGKIISQQQVRVNNKVQVVEYQLPPMTVAGNYLINVVNEANEVTSVNKIVVQ